MNEVFLHVTAVLIKCDDEQGGQKIQYNEIEFVPVIVPSSSN